MIHLNIVRHYVVAHPDWVDDCIPLCDCDGDGPQDAYTEVPKCVTCEACREEIARQALESVG